MNTSTERNTVVCEEDLEGAAFPAGGREGFLNKTSKAQTLWRNTYGSDYIRMKDTMNKPAASR